MRFFTAVRMTPCGLFEYFFVKAYLYMVKFEKMLYIIIITNIERKL
jgi:hypothetical protein